MHSNFTCDTFRHLGGVSREEIMETSGPGGVEQKRDEQGSNSTVTHSFAVSSAPSSTTRFRFMTALLCSCEITCASAKSSRNKSCTTCSFAQQRKRDPLHPDRASPTATLPATAEVRACNLHSNSVVRAYESTQKGQRQCKSDKGERNGGLRGAIKPAGLREFLIDLGERQP
jgi:hypothetical protein